MSYTLIYKQTLEIEGKEYHVQHFPGSLDRLIQAHPNHDIYVYEPEIVGTPVYNEETGEIAPPTVTRPTEWTPVDPVPAIVIPKTQA